MIKKIKIYVAYFLYFLINIFIRPSKEIREKTILLIRLDAIGDYILFRNFIEVLKKNQKYKNYSITLIGNNLWQSIAEELDSTYIDKFIWIDRTKFSNDMTYRYHMLKTIAGTGYEIVINPVFSREFIYDDTIVKLVNSKEKIGSVGDLSNVTKWQKDISDHYYTKLISSKNNIMFEFNRNKAFFEHFLNINIDLKKPYIELKNKNLPFKLPKNYAILFIGASATYKKWNIEGFVKIAKYLKSQYGYEIIICGGPADLEDAEKFEKLFDENILNLVGKTSLIELMYVISKGNLIISNETSAPHFAVALETSNVFVIYSGYHYGRFTPYPNEIAPNYHAIYHPEIEKDMHNYRERSNIYGFRNDLDINDISFEMVKEKIDDILHCKNSNNFSN